MFYAGIGSRETPEGIQRMMTAIAKKLEEKGHILRSGGAGGADLAFEKGVTNPEMKEIYLPWKGFNDSDSLLYSTNHLDMKAHFIGKTFHKGWKYLNNGARKLMARNGYQVLGQDLETPSDFIICWTPDGCESNETRKAKTGGTGQAISIADANDIPVFNLANEKSYTKLKEFLRK